MASSSSYPPGKNSPPIVIRFFTIIHSESLQLESLKIPKNFTCKYGDSVPNPVYLKPPDGTEWKIDWSNHDGEILFENGWKEFAAYYSLNHGHLVRFDYNRTCFQIHIFNMSGLEIEYPSNDQTGDDSVEILDELPVTCRVWSRKRLMTPESSPSATINVERGSQSEESNLGMAVIASSSKNLDVFHPGNSGFRALEEAQKFSSENPSFIVKIRKANLTRSRANFEAALFRRYFKKKEHDVKIRFEGNLMPAKLRYYENHNAIISAGWRPFARASKLQPGDVCVFELIDRDDPVFDVHIYRAQG